MENQEFLDKIKNLTGDELEAAHKEERQHQIVLLVTRQTNYSYDEAVEKLLERNNEYLKVIEEYICPNKGVKKSENKTINQKIYGEIRTLMDRGSGQTMHQALGQLNAVNQHRQVRDVKTNLNKKIG